MSSFSMTIPHDATPSVMITRNSHGFTFSIRANNSSACFALQYAHLQQIKDEIDRALICFGLDAEDETAAELEAAE
jgi:hypothetical protein